MLVLVIALAAIVLVSGCVQQAPESGTKVGEKLLDIEFKDSQGKTVKFSDFRGKAIIINSWAAWCPFCIDEIPLFQKLSDEYGNNMTVLLIHRTGSQGESFERGLEFINKFPGARGIKITDPVLTDPQDEFYKKVFGFGMPVSLIVDQNGIIKERKIGQFTEEELREKLDKILEFKSEIKVGQQKPEEIKTLPDGTKYLIHPDKFLSGGPGKDGIPSIDNPKFISAEEANWLPEKELGLGIIYKGEARFYPYRILVFHEIVNDFVQGDPILITYCPLCFTGIAFKREIDGEPVEFGVSGKLYNSELVMYDRKTDSYWPQSIGKAVVGSSTGKSLKKIPVDISQWGDWKKSNPNTKVLSRDTGVYPESKYSGTNLYGDFGDFTSIDLQFPVENKDSRLGDYEIVYGVEISGKFKAYKKSDLEQKQKIEDTVGTEKIKIEFDPNLKSAKAFKENGEEIVIDTLFWFAWAAFHPETELY